MPKRVSKALERSRRFSRFSKVRKGSLKVLKDLSSVLQALKKTISEAFTYSSKVLKGSPRFTRDREVR